MPGTREANSARISTVVYSNSDKITARRVPCSKKQFEHLALAAVGMFCLVAIGFDPQLESKSQLICSYCLASSVFPVT